MPDRREPAHRAAAVTLRRRNIRRALAGIAIVAAVSTGGIAAGVTLAEPRAPFTSDGDLAPGVLWEDDFDGDAGTLADPVDWTYQTGGGGWGNEELQVYREENGVLDGDGNLVISAVIDESAPDTERYTSARVASRGSFTFGLLEARIRLPDGVGLLPAFWLLGEDLERVGYPASGEIDVVETPFGTEHTIHSLHAPEPAGGPHSHGQVNVDVMHDEPLSDGFHVYAVLKTEERIEMMVDGETVAEFTSDSIADEIEWVFDKPFRVLFSLAIGGNWPGPPDASTPARSELVIDWVRLSVPEG